MTAWEQASRLWQRPRMDPGASSSVGSSATDLQAKLQRSARVPFACNLLS